MTEPGQADATGQYSCYQFQGVKLLRASELAHSYTESKFDFKPSMSTTAAEMEARSRTAMAEGTLLHDQIDCLLQGRPVVGDELPELAGAKRFIRDNPQLELAYTETVVSDERYRIGGRIDAIFKDTKTGLYHLLDWKRTKRLYPSSKFTYTMQQNLYRHMVRRTLGIKIDTMALCLIHPYNGCDEYDIVVIDRISLREPLMRARALADAKFGPCHIPYPVLPPSLEDLLN